MDVHGVDVGYHRAEALPDVLVRVCEEGHQEPVQLVQQRADPPLLLGHGALQHVQSAGVQETSLRPQRLLHQDLQHPVYSIGIPGLACSSKTRPPIFDGLYGDFPQEPPEDRDQPGPEVLRHLPVPVLATADKPGQYLCCTSLA